MKKLLFFIVAAVALTACGSDDSVSKDFGDIVVSDTREMTQGVSGEGDTPGTFHFTAKQSWSATAAESRALASWVTLQPASGGAGDVEMHIVVDENTTGSDRTATITIVCGDTKITIIIIQKPSQESGGNQDMGDQIGTIKKIIKGSDTAVFSYDEERRLSSIYWYEDGLTDDDLYAKTEFTYVSKTEVQVAHTEYDDYVDQNGGGTHIDRSNLTLRLNAEGYAEQLTDTSIDYGGSTSIDQCYIDYYLGRAISCKGISSGNSTWNETGLWTNGNLVEVTYDSSDKMASKLTYGELKNGYSIDLNFIIADSEAYGCYCEDGNYGVKVAGLLGKRSENMLTADYEYRNGSVYDYTTYTYKLDDKGMVSEITATYHGSGNYTDQYTYQIVY